MNEKGKVFPISKLRSNFLFHSKVFLTSDSSSQANSGWSFEAWPYLEKYAVSPVYIRICQITSLVR